MESDCIIWQGGVNSKGYPVARLSDGLILGHGRKKPPAPRIFVHRLAWIVQRGPIPAGMTIDHFYCFVKRCLNVEHMELVTRAENGRRGIVRYWEQKKAQ